MPRKARRSQTDDAVYEDPAVVAQHLQNRQTRLDCETQALGVIARWLEHAESRASRCAEIISDNPLDGEACERYDQLSDSVSKVLKTIGSVKQPDIPVASEAKLSKDRAKALDQIASSLKTLPDEERKALREQLEAENV